MCQDVLFAGCVVIELLRFRLQRVHRESHCQVQINSAHDYHSLLCWETLTIQDIGLEPDSFFAQFFASSSPDL